MSNLQAKLKSLFLEHLVTESLLDDNLLKAFILCGGPGAGKSYIVNIMNKEIYPQPKIVDADQLLEAKLKKRGLSLKWADPESDEFKKQWEAREESFVAQKQILTNYMNGYLSIIIDGTGQNIKKTMMRKKSLEDLGYDVMMIAVNCSLEVAQERNLKRARTIKPHVVEEIWDAVKKNIPTYKNQFENFIEVNNDPGELNKPEFISAIQKFYSSPLKNPIGQDIIKHKDTGPTMRSVKVDL